jgi:pimeloyl-ACP methyl ester carboxylesterase
VAEPTVLLLHAFPLDPRMWAAQQAALEGAGHTVAAPRLPPQPLEIGVEAWGQRVLEEVEGELVPVGCSMGGYLTFELWRRAQERISALALVGTRAAPDSPEQRAARDESIRLLGEAGREAFWEASGPRGLGSSPPTPRRTSFSKPARLRSSSRSRTSSRRWRRCATAPTRGRSSRRSTFRPSCSSVSATR